MKAPNSFYTQPRPISISVKRCSRKTRFAVEEGQQEEILTEKVGEEVDNWLRFPLRGNPELSPNLFSLTCVRKSGEIQPHSKVPRLG